MRCCPRSTPPACCAMTSRRNRCFDCCCYCHLGCGSMVCHLDCGSKPAGPKAGWCGRRSRWRGYCRHSASIAPAQSSLIGHAVKLIRGALSARTQSAWPVRTCSHEGCWTDQTRIVASTDPLINRPFAPKYQLTSNYSLNMQIAGARMPCKHITLSAWPLYTQQSGAPL